MPVQSSPYSQREKKNRSLKKLCVYVCIRILVFFIYFLPWLVVYKLSDLITLLMIKTNTQILKAAVNRLSILYPELPDNELKVIAENNIKHCIDIILENLKIWSMSTRQASILIKERYSIENNDLISNDRDTLIVTTHHGNWELASQKLQLTYRSKSFNFIYKPISNYYLDNYIYNVRQKPTKGLLKGLNVKSYLKTIVLGKKTKTSQARIYIVATDSTKPLLSTFNSITNLNERPEKYAKKYDLDILYLKTTKTKRGHCRIKLIPIDNNIKQHSSRLFREQLKEDPASWYYLSGRF